MGGGAGDGGRQQWLDRWRSRDHRNGGRSWQRRRDRRRCGFEGRQRRFGRRSGREGWGVWDGAGSAVQVVAASAASCKLPASVSFQKDVLPFLSATCGGGNGCHVIDSASTTANGGYDHAYDWITAGAHPSSCP